MQFNVLERVRCIIVTRSSRIAERLRKNRVAFVFGKIKITTFFFPHGTFVSSLEVGYPLVTEITRDVSSRYVLLRTESIALANGKHNATAQKERKMRLASLTRSKRLTTGNKKRRTLRCKERHQ